MIRRLGSFLSLAGFVGIIYTGINYFNNTESFTFLGADYIVSKGDPTGIIIAVGVLLLGLLVQYISS